MLVGLKVAQCHGCKYNVMSTEVGWLHTMPHGVSWGRPCGKPYPAKTPHKHRLVFKRVSNKGKRLIFECSGCGKERIYVRNRIHLLLMNSKTKFIKKDRSN